MAPALYGAQHSGRRHAARLCLAQAGSLRGVDLHLGRAGRPALSPGSHPAFYSPRPRVAHPAPLSLALPSRPQQVGPHQPWDRPSPDPDRPSPNPLQPHQQPLLCRSRSSSASTLACFWTACALSQATTHHTTLSAHTTAPLHSYIALTAPSPHPHRPSLCRRDFARPAALTPSRLPLSPCAVPLAPPGVCFDVCAPLNLHLTRLIPSPAVQPTSAPPHTDALCIPAGRGHLRHRRRGRRHRCRASAQATRAQQRAGTQQRVEGGVRLGHG